MADSKQEVSLTEPPDGPLYEGAQKSGKASRPGNTVLERGSQNATRASGETEKRHGSGIAYLTDGFKLYEGEWKENLRDGRGTYFWPDGDRYEGEWKEGLCHGKGTLYRPDGSLTYDGEWAGGYREGYGTAYRPKGDVLFEGQWKNGYSVKKKK